MIKNLSVALILFFLASFAAAGDINKCIDANGRTTFSDQPCPTGAPIAANSSATTGTSSAINNTAAPPAGKIDLLTGDVHVLDSHQKPRIVHVGDNVYEGDNIVTGSDGEVHMTMADEGFIAVRSNTKMNITQYRAQGDDQDKGVIGLLVGSLRCITGWIGKYQPRSYQIKTPTATIGIRGTDHEPMVIPEGSTEGDPGTYDKVNAGGSYIKTEQGSVDVTPQHAGFAPFAGKRGVFRPRLLNNVPRFYRRSRFENLIDGKHEVIQHILAKRREEMRMRIRENRLRQREHAAFDAKNERASMTEQKRLHRENMHKRIREEESSEERPEHKRRERQERE
jgi:hypothetical protein